MRRRMHPAAIGLLMFLTSIPAPSQCAGESPEALPNFASLLEEIQNTIRGGGFAEAEARARDLLARAEQAYGRDSVEAALVLDLLVEALYRGGKGKEPEARESIERAIIAKEKALGPDHPEVAISLNRSGNLYLAGGDLVRAKALFERVLAIRESHFGRNSPEVAKVLNNLAIVHFEKDEFEMARDLYLRALEIYEGAPGVDEIVVARSLNNLGNALYKLGDYSGALTVLGRTRESFEKAIGPTHPEAANIPMNLGSIQLDLGDLAQARSLFETALRLFRESAGDAQSMVPQLLHNLALVANEEQDYERARSLFGEALRLYEKSPGPEDHTMARSLNALADVLMALGRAEEARSLIERALAIREKYYGTDHHEVAESRNSLGDYFRSAGDYARAREHFQQAVAIYEKSLGASHPLVAKSLVDLAQMLATMDETAGALDDSLRAEEIAREHLKLTARTLAERQALRYASVRTRGLDLALSLAGSALGPSSLRRVWDSLIRSRALVLDEVAARHRIVHGAAEVSRLAGALFAANQRLANLSVRGPGEDPPNTYRTLLENARRGKEDAERALAERSVTFQQLQARGPIGASEVAAALPPRAALVSFVRYARYPLHTRQGTGPTEAPRGPPRTALTRPTPESSYLALVIRTGESAPRPVALGRSDEIEALVDRWREEAASGARLPGRSATVAESTYRAAASALRRRIWDPVAPHLDGASLVLVVPDGALHLVNFSALPGRKRGYLLEEGPRIQYLSSEKDLVRPAGSGVRGRGLLALGGPAFDEPKPSAPRVPGLDVGPRRAQVASAAPYRGERSGCGDFHSMRFAPLPASAREVQEIVALWQRAGPGAAAGFRGGEEAAAGVSRLMGAKADEASLKEKVAGRRVLHLATHAFFLGGRCPSALEGARGIGGLVPTPNLEARPVAGENPLLLAGLALAGANRRDEAGPDEEDGILTAEEIAALDLTGVEWAVLSACDTGLGEVRAGEGVFGLRRAFQVAGAGTLILSLWAVEDEAALKWMRGLYEARLVRGLGTAEAVRETSLKILRDRGAAGESTHPFFWGAFVAAGDWR